MAANTKEEKWRRDEEYVIELEVRSNGMTGAEWYEKFDQTGFHFGQEYTIEVQDLPHLLQSPQFDEGVTDGKKYQLVILKGIAFRGWDLYFDDVREEAARRGFSPVHPETACLVLDKWGKEGIRERAIQGVFAMTEELSRSLAMYIPTNGQLSIIDVPMNRSDPNLSTQGFMFQRIRK